MFHSHQLWIHNLSDLVVILSFLCYQYHEALIGFLVVIGFLVGFLIGFLVVNR